MTRIRHLGVPLAVVAILAVVPKLPLDIPVVFSGPLDSPGTLGLLALCLLFAGVAARLLLGYQAADLTLEGAFLAGLIDGPYLGVTVGVLVGLPPLAHGEIIAPMFAVGCGFAGGGLRELHRRERLPERHQQRRCRRHEIPAGRRD